MAWNNLITKLPNELGLLQVDSSNGEAQFKLKKNDLWSPFGGVRIKDVSYSATTHKLTFTNSDSTTKEVLLSDLIISVSRDPLTGILTFTKADESTITIEIGLDDFLADASYDPETYILSLTMSDDSVISVDMAALVTGKADKVVSATVDTIPTLDSSGNLQGTLKRFGDTTFNVTPNTATIPNESSVVSHVSSVLSDYVTELELAGFLSDFVTDAELSSAGYMTELDVSNLGYITSSQVDSGYVAKETGKGLSTNDYTEIEKLKLASIDSGAESNVNADWNATSGDSQILNKPTIPSKTSDLTNDSDFTTSLAVSSGYVAKDGSKVLSDNNYDSTSKTKLDNLANITTIGDNLTLTNGTLEGAASSGVSVTWHIIDSNTTASVNNGYMINAVSGAIDLTLPSLITLGDTVYIKIINNTNTVTIKRNGNNIEGLAEDLIIDTDRAGFHLVASDTTNGWLISTEISGIIDGGGTPTGTIETFAGDIPEGFIELEATKTVSRTTYANLFSVIGAKYSRGNGTTTFGLPDAKIGIDNSLLSDVLPVSKYASSIVTLLDGRILVLGGYASATLTSCHIGTVTGSIITWESATALPEPLYAMTTTVLADGRIIVVGGGNDSGSVNTIYFGTVSNNIITWTLSASVYPIVIRQHATVLMDDGRLICLGGYSSDITTAVHIGTISGNTVTWASGTVLGTARRGMKVIKTSSDSFVIIGGLLGTNVTGDCTFGTISGNTITWATSDALPVVRFWSSCGLLKDNSILCVGGSNTTSASTATTTIYKGQVNAVCKNIAWTLLGHIQITVASVDGTLTDNSFIIAGGNGTGGVSDKTQIIPLRRQGIKI